MMRNDVNVVEENSQQWDEDSESDRSKLIIIKLIEKYEPNEHRLPPKEKTK